MSMKKKKGLWIALGIFCGIYFVCMVGFMGLMTYMLSVEKESSREVSAETTETESSDATKESSTDESESSAVEESEATYNSTDAEQMLDELLELYEQRPSVSELE